MTDIGTIGLQGIAVKHAEERVSLHEVAARAGVTDRQFRHLSLLGIETVAVSEMSSVDLAVAAAGDLLTQNQITKSDIGVLVHVSSRVPEHLISSESTRVQNELGLSGCFALGTGDLGCASSSMAIKVAAALLQQDPAMKYALVTHGSKAATQSRLRYPLTVNGDAGMAILLTNEPARWRLRSIHTVTDGRYWDLFRMPFQDIAVAEWSEECRSPEQYNFDIAAHTASILKQYLSQKDIQHPQEYYSAIVAQNLSESSFRFHEELLGMPVSPYCRLNLRHLGHLGAVDTYLNVASVLADGLDGRPMLAINNSPAAAWSMVEIEECIP